MPDSPQPPRKIPSKLPPPGTKPGSKPAASSDASRKLPPAKPRAVKPAPAAAEPDEFDQPIKRKLPPVVVKKKPKVKRDLSERERPSGPSQPASEFLAPLILIPISLVLVVLTSMLIPNIWGASPGTWTAISLGLIAGSTVITIGALFVAAYLLDTDFGFFHTACLKVAAITLTQDWVETLAVLIPVPFVPWLITTLVTYSLFKYFFELDEMEIFGSIAIIRLVHWVVFFFAIAAVMAMVLGGANIGDMGPEFDGDNAPIGQPLNDNDPAGDDADMEDAGGDF